MKKIINWVLAAIFICGASAFTSCSNNDDNPVVDNSLAEKIVGKWIHADTDRKDGTRTGKSSPARAARWSIKPYIGAPTAPLTPSPRT